MNKKIIKRQEYIFELISGYIAEKGYAPTYQELANSLNIKSKQ